MKNSLNAIKTKLFLGYLILAIIVGLSGWLVYTEIIETNNEKIELNPINEKIVFINDILANLYNAEGLERNLDYTGKSNTFAVYEQLIDTIKIQLDSLTLLNNIPAQKKHADSIRVLLDIKQKNHQELIYLKKNYSLNALYKQSMRQLEEEKDSIIQFYEVNQQLTKIYDTVYVKQSKKPFFNRLFKAFGNKSTEDSAMQVQIRQYMQTDSIKANANPSDSVAVLLSKIGAELKLKSARAEKQIRKRELAILESDKTISLQLKKILSILEQEELLNTFSKVQLQQEHNRKIMWITASLGLLSILTLIFFAINIFSDLTKSQHYRQGLEDAKAKTEQVLKSKEQFMLSLTHDLKSPLNAIIGFTRLLEKKQQKGTESKYIKNIDRSSQHILGLVNHLLDLAKLQQGSLKFVTTPFNFSSLIEQVSDNYKFGATQKNVLFTVNNALSSSQNYQGDFFRITQILINLVSNAIKFTHKGSIEIRVTSESINRHRDKIKIEVIDSGIGIDKEDLPHVFEEFSRGKAEHKQYEGTGLGLAITSKLIKLMHGSITVKSEVEKGSHFTVLLPLLLTDEEVKPSMANITINDPITDYKQLKGLSVWLVDDDEYMREMVEAVLRAEGVLVKPFSDPTKVLKAFNDGCTDLLITDLQMPEMDGTDLIQNIEKKIGSRFPTILMSGRNDPPTSSISSHLLAYIQKPFEPVELLHIIHQNIHKLKKTSREKNNRKQLNVAYNLSNIKQFLGEDSDTLTKFLQSYTSSSLEHIALLQKYRQQKDFKNISELAHKMLNILHQLEVVDLIEIFKPLETKQLDMITEVEYLELTSQAIDNMKVLIASICEDENIQAT